MAGYSRQSVADIVSNAVIKAAPVNAEYNSLRDAFAFATGHKHDGSSTEGAYVPLIADTDALNKVVINTSNNRIGFFVEVSSSAVEQLRIQDGAIVPVTDNDVDLGASGQEFKDLYIDGIGYIDSVVITGGTIDNAVIGGSTAAAGNFTNVGLSGNLTVSGTSGLSGTTTITTVDINSGAIDNTTIGNSSAAAGSFTSLNASGTATLATVDINAGAIDGATIGGNSAAAGSFTSLGASGTATLATVDINGGAIDGATIGASSTAAGNFTTVATSGQATLATVDINGGSIDGAVIGASSGAAITGTTITATTGFVGDVTGDITGNITGNISGVVTGNVTGNITANSGTSTFNNVTINGGLDMNASSSATITNLTSPSNSGDAATKGYVDTEVSNLVASAPGTLDTLNELAAALGDDANFSTTITNSIATKLPLAGGTLTGNIAMGTNKITGLGNPSANQDAVTKSFADSTFLSLSGGTMTGAISMGSNKITASYTPNSSTDLTTKAYVDNITGSLQSAQTNATNAATSATNAASSATAAASSATSAASSATAAAASFDSFDDKYLGAKSSAPSTDNDGDALSAGVLYFNTSTNSMQVFGDSGFQNAGSSVNGTSSRNTYTATSGQTSFSSTYDAGFVDVYLNGLKLLSGTDYTASNGTTVVLASGATAGDIVDIVAYGTFTLATHYTKTQTDDRYLQLSGGTLTGNIDVSSSDIVSTSNANIDLLPNGSGKVVLDGNGSSGGVLVSDGLIEIKTGTGSRAETRFYCESSNAHYTGLRAAPHSSYSGNVTFSLPAGDGSSGQFMKTDGSGQLSFATINTDLVNDTSPQLGGALDTNGNNITASGDLTIDVVGSIILDADNDAVVQFKDGGTTIGQISSSSQDLGITASVQDKDIKFFGNDGGSSVTALTLDMSAAGAATFNSGVTVGGSVTFGNWTITESSGSLFFATGGANKMKLDASGNLDVVGNVNSNATL